MNPPNLPTFSLYTLTLREVRRSEALIYTMPTVAAGGGHILNIDFFCCKLVKEATGQRAARAKTITLLTMKKKKDENKAKKLFLNKEKLRLLLKLWQIRRQNCRRKVQFPPLATVARRVARRVRIVRNCKATVH